MTVGENRGGVPYVLRETIDTTGRKIRIPFFIKYLKIRVTTSPLKLFFTEENFDANNTRYVLIPVPAAETPYGEWEGPVEAGNVWVKGDGGNSVIELVGFQRRA